MGFEKIERAEQLMDICTAVNYIENGAFEIRHCVEDFKALLTYLEEDQRKEAVHIAEELFIIATHLDTNAIRILYHVNELL